jgi:outer membrane protein assembly factor BamB
VSNNLVVTSLFEGKLLALNRTTGKVVFAYSLPATTNSTLAIAGDTIIVPMGGPKDGKINGGTKILAFRVPTAH